ncbi:RTX toxin transporter [Vibrio cholerae]|nr:RTX toxin transporter [Vibrio cholerae]
MRELDTIREFLTGSMFTLTVELLFMFVAGMNKPKKWSQRVMTSSSLITVLTI